MANGTMLPKAKPFPSSIRPPDAVSGNWGGRKESGWDGAETQTLTKYIYVDLIRQPEKPWHDILKQTL